MYLQILKLVKSNKAPHIYQKKLLLNGHLTFELSLRMLLQMCLICSPRLVCTTRNQIYLPNLARNNPDFCNMVDILERKDKIEDGNRILVQQFQSQLTKQLDVLHKSVAASVTQQEQQLKGMEDDMQSFVSTKDQV